MANRSDNLKRTIPSVFKPTINPNWKALLEAIGEALDGAEQNITNANEQLFVNTAQEKFLEARGDNYGVRKFSNVLLTDTEFRELIKVLSFKPKQVRDTVKAFLELFFSNNPDLQIHEINPNELVIQMPVTVPVIIDRLEGSHHFHSESGCLVNVNDSTDKVTMNLDANINDLVVLNKMRHTSDWSGTTDVSNIELSNDSKGKSPQSIIFDKSGGTEAFGEISWSFNIVKDLSDFDFLTHFIKLTDNTDVTNITVTLGDGSGTSSFDFDASVLLDNEWNCVNYDLSSPDATTGGGVDLELVNSISIKVSFNNTTDTLNDIKIDEISAIGSGFSFNSDFFAGQTLKQNDKSFNIVSSTAGHTNIVLTVTDGIDSDLPDLDKSNKAHILFDDWPGSFLYNPDGGLAVYFSAQTILDDNIAAGDFGGLTNFIDSSSIPDAPGFLVFDFGTDNEEGPVPYISRPNNSTLVLDPAYQFTKSHNSGAVTILADDSGHEPDDNGSDYGVFATSIQIPSQTAQDEVQKITAAGVIIRFILISPEDSCLFT